MLRRVTLPPESSLLREALVSAYRGHARARIEALGADPSEHGAAVEAGRAWLDGALTELLSVPWRDQRRSPLEVFQEAMRFPTESLAAAGIAPAARDAGQHAALPGDAYDLAPASSQELGEEAWQAHLAWGAAKARALAAAGAVLYFGNNLMDRSAIDQAAKAAGLHAEAISRPAEAADAAGRVLRAYVDLTHPGADEAIRALAGAGVPVVAFGPHVDDWALDRARSLGADQALPRSKFFRRLADLMPARA